MTPLPLHSHASLRGVQLIRWLLAAVLALHIGAAPAQSSAGTAGPSLRIASAFDPQTMDPHGLALLYHSRVVFQIYDCLVNRSEDFKLEPGLATEWRMVNPTTWRFRLRQAVRFHDGSPFTADDAVFSIERAWNKPSQRSFHFTGLKEVRKVDEQTIEFVLATPDAVWPEKLVFIAMMSKTWSEKNGAAKAQDFNAKQEMHTVRNANGTGPFRLLRYEPDVRTVLARHVDWWGRGDRRNGNLAEVSFVSVKSDATRLAALASGEVDFVFDPPFQDVERLKTDPKIQVVSVPDIGTQYFTFDQARNELLHGDVKDRNPFKDKRVRQAVAHALNVDLIVQKVLRGQAVPTGSLVSPLVEGYAPDMDRRHAYDPTRAKALLAEAGYPGGFGVTLDCVNVAWREAVCQAAAAMLSQVGIRTQVRSAPSNQFFPKLSQATASFIEYGWTASPDAWNTLNGLFRSWDPAGGGTFNAGRYSNPQVDQLVDAVRTEPDLVKRRARVGVVLRMVSDDLAYLPLYRRKLNWAMTKKVSVVQWPNDTMELRWVRLR